MKRKIAGLLIGGMMITSFCTTAFAATFPDLNSSNWGWAKTNIEEMSSKGIIAGFPDGTFKPAEGVTKLQSLILIARILGVNEKVNADYVKLAEETYTNSLKSYTISNKTEVAFLLYKDIIHTDELDTYVSSQNAGAAIKRYEAAILLTKAMGSEAQVKNKLMTVLSYSDAASIPAQAKSYVEYVKEQNIMQGMSDTEFGPMGDVTRAQMAVMLYRVMEKDLYRYNTGVVTEVDEDKSTLKIREDSGNYNTFNIKEDTILKLDGEDSKLRSFVVGTSINVTTREGKLYMIEGLIPVIDETVKGIVSDIVISGSTKKISIIEDEDSDDEKDYVISEDVIVKYNGETTTIASVKEDDTVELDIRNGKVIRIDAESMLKVVSGTIQAINSDSKVLLTLKDEDGRTKEYEVLSNVTVRKNGKNSDLQSVTIGDEADVTLAYDKVNKIEATSDKSTVEGTIEEIVISKNPSIKIKKNDKIYSYSIPRDLKIEIDDDNDADIYDLRLSYPVKVSLESNTIVKMEVQRMEETQQITGRVELVNPSYNYINITAVDAASGESTATQVFVKKAAKIINSNSTSTKNLYVDDIEVGDTITAVGTTSTGVFEASTVIIIKSE